MGRQVFGEAVGAVDVAPDALAQQLLSEAGPPSPLDAGVRARSRRQGDLPVANFATALLNRVLSMAVLRANRVVTAATDKSDQNVCVQ